MKYRDFEFLIAYVVHLINRRPVALKDALRDTIGEDIPDPITPECLIHGYDLISVNIIPELQVDSEPDWQPVGYSNVNLREDYQMLQKVRLNLIKIYQEEFLANLIKQAVDKPDRYKPVTHKHISPGDVVLLKETFTKPNDYPMGVVKEAQINDLGEVTGALILKGKSKELVKHHASVIIPLLSVSCDNLPNTDCQNHDKTMDDDQVKARPKRKAAILSSEATKRILQE